MPTQYILGPAIAGSSYRYWEVYKSNTSARRKKPTDALSLLSNPTTYYAERYRLTTNADVGRDGITLPPSNGPLLAQSNRIPYSVRSRVENNSLIKVKKKIKDEKWSLGTFLGELPETQKYCMKAAKEIVGLYSSVKKGKISMKSLKRLARKGRNYLRNRGALGSIKDGAGTISSRWLEWRYAVSPMVYDLQDSLNYLHRSTLRPLISRSAAGAKDTYVLYRASTSTRSAESEIYTINGRAVVYYRVNPHAQALKHLGLINLGAVLWELTPLSFVVDIFLPVGDFISDLDTMAGVSVLSCTYSQRISGIASRPDQSYRIGIQTPDGWIYQNGRRGGTQSELETYGRSKASLDVKFNFSKSPSGTQLFDLVALMRQLAFS